MNNETERAWAPWARAGIAGCVFLGLMALASMAQEDSVRKASGTNPEKYGEAPEGIAYGENPYGSPDPTYGPDGVQTPAPPTPAGSGWAFESHFVDSTGRPVAATDYFSGAAGIVIGAADGTVIDGFNFLPTAGIFNSIACVAPVATPPGTIAGCGSRDNDVLLELQDGTPGPPTIDVRSDLSTAGFDAAFTCSVTSGGQWVLGGVQGPHAFSAVGQYGGAFNELIVNVTPQPEAFAGHAVDSKQGVVYYGGTAGSEGLVCKVDLATVTLISTFGPDGTGCLLVDVGQVATTVTGVGLLNNGNIVVTGTAEDNDRTRAFVTGFGRVSGTPSPDFPTFFEAIPSSTSSEAWGIDVFVDNGASSGVAAGIVRLAEPPAENSDILLMFFDERGPARQFNHDFAGSIVRAANPTSVDVFFPPPGTTLPQVPRVGVAGNSNGFNTPYFARFFGRIPGTIFYDGFGSGNFENWTTAVP